MSNPLYEIYLTLVRNFSNNNYKLPEKFYKVELSKLTINGPIYDRMFNRTNPWLTLWGELINAKTNKEKDTALAWFKYRVYRKKDWLT